MKKAKRGHLISFEGISGAGKSSALAHLKQHLRSHKIECVVKTDLLGFTSTGVGGDIKGVLDSNRGKNDRFQFGYPVVESLLILAKRACESKDKLIPALNEGKVVLADRDIDTVCTYQLVSLLDETLPYNFTIDELVGLLRSVNRLGSVEPSLTFYLTVSMPNAKKRLEERDGEKVLPAKVKFDKRATDIFEKVLALPIPNRTIVRIDTDTMSKAQVFEKVLSEYNAWKP